MAVRPIKPDEVDNITAKEADLPDGVIEVVNKLIKKNWNGRFAEFKQKEAAVLVAQKLNITKDEVYNRRLLDFERIYESQGWKVFYDKPIAYGNDSYDAYWRFARR